MIKTLHKSVFILTILKHSLGTESAITLPCTTDGLNFFLVKLKLLPIKKENLCILPPCSSWQCLSVPCLQEFSNSSTSLE